MQRIQQHLPLLIVACFVIGWVIARDYIQSITIDEADTYVYFASGKIHTQWEAYPNNHLLNTLLIHLFTTVFGLHNLTMRAPALIGAGLYIAAAYRLCFLVLSSAFIRLLLFACLVLNPFLMDFFVAARGYSLALGFLFVALLLLCRQLMLSSEGAPTELWTPAIASTCLGISFTSNFSFAIVDASTIALFFLFVWWDSSRTDPGRAEEIQSLEKDGYALRPGKLALACTLPGVLWIFFIASWTIAKWPGGLLVYGSHSILEMWREIITPCFFEVNSQVINPLLFRSFHSVTKYLPYVTMVLMCITGAQIIIDALRGSKAGRPQNRLFWTEMYIAGIFCATLFGHWMAFHLFGLLLPKGRTGIFFVPLATLLIGISCVRHSRSDGERVLNRIKVTCLCVGVISFISCLRLSYFYEWKFDADIQPAYQALVKAVGKGRNIEVPCWFLYTSALNYYREYYHDSSFQRFALTFNGNYKTGDEAYVLVLPQDQKFLDQQHLKTVFHGHFTGLVVGVKEGTGLSRVSILNGNHATDAMVN